MIDPGRSREPDTQRLMANKRARAIEVSSRELLSLDGSQQRFDVLADVVIARAFAEILGVPVVVFQREAGDFFQLVRSQKGILPRGWPDSQCEAARTELVASIG